MSSRSTVIEIRKEQEMKELMRYIPKEFKDLVVDIYEGEQEWNEYTKRWNRLIVVEWQNGETSTFQNRSWMRAVLTEEHLPQDFAE